jgi:hypothetical protein
MSRSLFTPSTSLGSGSPTLTAGSLQTTKTNNSGDTLIKCQAVRVEASDEVDLALADDIDTAQVIGLVAEEIADTESGLIQMGGELEATTGEWDAVTGDSGGLVVGDIYYLSSATEGNLTSTATTTIGEAVARIGTASSTTKMIIEIGQPVEL